MPVPFIDRLLLKRPNVSSSPHTMAQIIGSVVVTRKIARLGSDGSDSNENGLACTSAKGRATGASTGTVGGGALAADAAPDRPATRPSAAAATSRRVRRSGCRRRRDMLAPIGRSGQSECPAGDAAIELVQQFEGGAGVPADPPVVDVLDRQRREMVPTLTSSSLHEHESGLVQHLEVLHHRAPVEVRQRRAQLAAGARPVAQLVEQATAGRRGQRLEHGVVGVAVTARDAIPGGRHAGSWRAPLTCCIFTT